VVRLRDFGEARGGISPVTDISGAAPASPPSSLVGIERFGSEEWFGRRRHGGRFRDDVTAHGEGPCEYGGWDTSRLAVEEGAPIAAAEQALLRGDENRLRSGGVVVGVRSPMSDHMNAAAPSDDDAGFEEFYKQQHVDAVRLAAFLSGDRTMSEDLAQEAFLGVQAAFGRLDNPAGYLRTTLVNLCRNQRRAKVREAVRFTRHGASPTTVSDQAQELDATLHRLPYDERAVVVLRYWLGLSEAEIAEHLGCRPGTVKSRSARALKKIRKEVS